VNLFTRSLSPGCEISEGFLHPSRICCTISSPGTKFLNHFLIFPMIPPGPCRTSPGGHHAPHLTMQPLCPLLSNSSNYMLLLSTHVVVSLPQFQDLRYLDFLPSLRLAQYPELGFDVFFLPLRFMSPPSLSSPRSY